MNKGAMASFMYPNSSRPWFSGLTSGPNPIIESMWLHGLHSKRNGSMSAAKVINEVTTKKVGEGLTRDRVCCWQRLPHKLTHTACEREKHKNRSKRMATCSVGLITYPYASSLRNNWLDRAGILLLSFTYKWKVQEDKLPQSRLFHRDGSSIEDAHKERKGEGNKKKINYQKPYVQRDRKSVV